MKYLSFYSLSENYLFESFKKGQIKKRLVPTAKIIQTANSKNFDSIVSDPFYNHGRIASYARTNASNEILQFAGLGEGR